jgi:hypothetical protein
LDLTLSTDTLKPKCPFPMTTLRGELMPSQTERLRKRLENTRTFSMRLLEDFNTPEEWARQLHEGGNHAIWFIGHMGTTDNFMISVLSPERSESAGELGDKFGMGSQPSSKVTDYPPVDELLAYMAGRREVFMEILGEMDDAALAEKTPEGSPGFMTDYASVFETAIWHEALHCGQLSMIRRALGNPPIVS